MDSVERIFGMRVIGPNTISEKKKNLSLCTALQYFDLKVFKNYFKERRAVTESENLEDDRCSNIDEVNVMYVFELLLSNKKDLHHEDDFGFTNLHIACSTNRLDIVQYVIENCGIDINSQVSFKSEISPGYIPLHFAAERSNLEVVQYLVNQGADVCAVNAGGSRPLHLAFRKNQIDLYDILTPRLNIKYEDHFGLTFFHIHCARNCFNSMADLFNSSGREILDARISDNDLEFGVYTVLYFACSTNRLDIVQYVIENCGIDINSHVSFKSETLPGYTPLHFAAERSNLEVVQYLVNKGADICAVNAEGSRPLHLAFRKKQIDLYDILTPRSNINYEDYFGLTFFHIHCARNCFNSMADLFNSSGREILDARISDNDLEFGGYTALHFAAKNGFVDIVSWFLRLSADFTIQDSIGCTPLHLAFYAGHENVLHTFLENDELFEPLKNSTDNQGLSILHFASMGTNTKLMKYILEEINKTDINTQINEKAEIWPGYTPLHLAVEYERIDFAELLLQRGADPNISNKTGKTPLHFACQISNFKRELKFSMLTENLSYDKRSSKINIYRLFQLLIRFRANTNVRDEAGRTPLLFIYDEPVKESPSQTYGKVFITNFHFIRDILMYEIIQSGANIHVADYSGVTLLHSLVQNYRYNTDLYSVIESVLKYKVDINARTKDGLTALSMALEQEENEKLINLLLKCGADPNVIENDDNDSTVFHNFIVNQLKDHKSIQILQMLLEYGADVNEKLKNGKNALHLMASKLIFFWKLYDPCKCGWCTLKRYYNYNWNVNSQDLNGRTPLHYAALKDDKDSVNVLLNIGSDINIIDNDGFTPLDYIVQCQGRCISLVFTNHVEMLNRIGMYINQSNRELIKLVKVSKLVNIADNQSESDQINDNIDKAEVKRLKLIKLDRFTTLYDVFFMSTSKLSRYIDNPVFRQSINDVKFDKWLSFLRLQFNKGYTRAPLLESAKDALTFIIGLSLPDSCSETILDFLDDANILRLIDANPDDEKQEKENRKKKIRIYSR